MKWVCEGSVGMCLGMGGVPVKARFVIMGGGFGM